eukprot:CAMPEP_0180136266 /NCGR_PEP_ID=MMETSP0986-20121125/11392_1 /TAXON_ID=697907 /ORGANISM="non described non described, Strain CCMP2293" /LENGTH=85 /DNA_ID=CAMNT_0022077259 /DNA_START=210 /DNA_END=467 /DNA_ORIENTATION=-
MPRTLDDDSVVERTLREGVWSGRGCLQEEAEELHGLNSVGDEHSLVRPVNGGHILVREPPRVVTRHPPGREAWLIVSRVRRHGEQ